MGTQKKFAACAAVAVAASSIFAAVEPDNAGGESKGSRRYDKENLLWQSTVAIKSDPVGLLLAPWIK